MSSYHGGLAAEEAAERWYLERGATPVAKRWRGPGGEIDLIVRMGETLIFVEVKLRRSLADAAAAITPRQWARIMATVEAYLAAEGLPLDTDLRVDAALLDRNGGIEVIENAAPY